MASPTKRETLSNQILQQVDSPDRSLMLVKDTPSATPLSFTGNVPFWKVDLREVDLAPKKKVVRSTWTWSGRSTWRKNKGHQVDLTWTWSGAVGRSRVQHDDGTKST